MADSMDKEVAHKQLLDILCIFDKLCSEHHIRYTLHGGTLLGAIRGKDFIPWDDDADVAMSRAEFQKLELALKDAAPEYYIRGNIKKQFCNKGDPNIWVDIFICDYISENNFFRRIKLGLLTVLDVMNRDRESMKLSNLEEYSRTKQLVYKALFLVGKIFPKTWLAKWYVCVSEKWFLGKRQRMFRSSDHYVGRKKDFPAQWLEHVKRITFAECQLPVLEEYDRMLLQCYGKDYMTPVFEERYERVHDLIRSDKRIEL